MMSTTLMSTALFTLIAIGITAGYPSVLTNSAIYNDNEVFESRNFFQQLAINQIVNVLPQKIRDKINDAAASFSMTRNDFLIKCLKELQAFQTYSKIDFITAIQKVVKFMDEKVTPEQQEELQAYEAEGLQVAALILTNQIKSGQLNSFYDLIVKMVRQQINGETMVNEVPKILQGILSQHF